MNLKMILMQLGNKLVTEHGFDPRSKDLHSCTKIQDLTKWINEVPEAQQCLRELDVEWPMAKF